MSSHQPALFVEPARSAHIHDMRAVDARVYPTPWSIGLWTRELSRPAAEVCYVVVSIGGQHVGHGGIMVQAGDGHVVTVAVDPARQRQGVATAIMVVLAARSLRLGLDALTLEVRLGNQSAQALYRRFGFAPAGIRSDYYADDGEDALIMWAHGVAEGDFRDRLDRILEGVGPMQLHPALSAVVELPAREDAAR